MTLHTARNGKKRQKKVALLTTTAICLLRHARRRRKTPSCWVRSWLLRRDESGFSDTLVRELERDDKAQYKSMFRMDKDTFQFLLEKVKKLTHFVTQYNTG